MTESEHTALQDRGVKIGELIIQISTHEVIQLKLQWKASLSDEVEVNLFAEYSILLISFIDRLASQSMSNKNRVHLMEAICQAPANGFARQLHHGSSASERFKYFMNLMVKRMDYYARAKSIMGDERENMVWLAACVLVEIGLHNQDINNRADYILEVGKRITMDLMALTEIDLVKELNR